MKKRFRGEKDFATKTKEEMRLLLEERRLRKKDTILAVIGIGGAGAGVFTLFKPTLKHALAAAIAAGLPAGTAKYMQESRKVKEATKRVQKVLVDEAQENPDLVKFLKKYKYVIIDRNGNIAGTNMPRLLGIGRIRLSAKKIIEGKYE